MAYKIGSFNVRNKLFDETISDGGESDYSIISKPEADHVDGKKTGEKWIRLGKDSIWTQTLRPFV
jgi:hypothetical protein